MTCSSSSRARRSLTPGGSRPADRDVLEVGRRVDVVRAAGVAALDQRDELGAGAQERPGALVAGGRRDDLGPVLAGQGRGAGLPGPCRRAAPGRPPPRRAAAGREPTLGDRRRTNSLLPYFLFF